MDCSYYKEKVALFTYISANGKKKKEYPFRVGDIVTVRLWGKSYSDYKRAYMYFAKKIDTPYYNEFLRKRNGVEKFKIIKIAEHSDSWDIIAYISDRNKRCAVISLDGLYLDKQFPLRINESQIIKLEKIKYL